MDLFEQVKQDSELKYIEEEVSLCSKCKSDLDNKLQVVVNNPFALSSRSISVMESNGVGLNKYEEKPNISDLDKLARATTKSFSQVSLNGEASLDDARPKCPANNNDNGQPCKKLKCDGSIVKLSTDHQDFAVETQSKSTKNQLKTTEKKSNISSTIVSIVLNRKKRLAQLANDVFRLSSYLDDIREAINVKELSEIVRIPDPPIFDDYDSQFDFANQKRFGALPIRIRPVDNNKTKLGALNGDSHRRQVLANRPLNAIKRLNNNVVPSTTFHHGRRSIKQSVTGKSCKENRNTKNSLNIISVSNSGMKKKIAGDITSVSSSMYNYNPLKTPVV